MAFVDKNVPAVKSFFENIYAEWRSNLFDLLGVAEPTLKADEVKRLTLPEIERLLVTAQNFQDYTGELKALLRKLASDAAARLVNEMKFDVVFDASSNRITKIISDRATFVLGEMKDANYQGLREVLLEGYNQGESVQQIADRIDEYTGKKFNTSPETIARTEIIGANNMANVEVYKQAGFPKKRWVSTRDDKVRPAHQAADNQVVDINLPFVVGSSLLQYPGDKSAFPEDWLNCRCVVLAEE